MLVMIKLQSLRQYNQLLVLLLFHRPKLDLNNKLSQTPSMDLSAQLQLKLKTLVQMLDLKNNKEEKDQFNIHLKRKQFWTL